MSHRTTLRAGVVLTSLAVLLGADPAMAALSGDVANVAHRGASRKAPENTMAAVTQAVADHADFVGIDVRLTRDRVPVVLHDGSLERTTDVENVFPGRAPWSVDDFTLAEIRELDAGSWKSATYRRERVPTLAAVLRELADSPTGMLLEVKDPERYGGPAGIGHEVMATVARGWPDVLGPDQPRFVLQSFDKEFLREMHERYPTVRAGLLGPADAPRMQQYGFADNVHVRADTVTQEYVDEVHASGVTVGAWTVNSQSRMHDLLQLGVDAITTDRPDVLHAVLDERGVARDPGRWERTGEVAPEWQLDVPARVRRGARVRVAATLSRTDGSPVRWQWAAVQRRVDGRWETLQTRATDSRGRLHTTVKLRRGVRLRVRTAHGTGLPVSRSAAQTVAVRKQRGVVSLSGQHRVRRGKAAHLTVRWHTSAGRSLSGRATLWKRPGGSRWRPVRTVRVHDGFRELRVSPRRSTRYRLRAAAGWWFTGDSDRHRVRVSPRGRRG